MYKINLLVVKLINLWQVSKQHVPFVLQGRRDEVAELRVSQLCKITLETAGKETVGEKTTTGRGNMLNIH